MGLERPTEDMNFDLYVPRGQPGLASVQTPILWSVIPLFLRGRKRGEKGVRRGEESGWREGAVFTLETLS